MVAFWLFRLVKLLLWPGQGSSDCWCQDAWKSDRHTRGRQSWSLCQHRPMFMLYNLPDVRHQTARSQWARGFIIDDILTHISLGTVTLEGALWLQSVTHSRLRNTERAAQHLSWTKEWIEIEFPTKVLRVFLAKCYGERGRERERERRDITGQLDIIVTESGNNGENVTRGERIVPSINHWLPNKRKCCERMRERLRQESLTPSEKVGTGGGGGDGGVCDGVDVDVCQVSIWHRDITLVTPRQMKGGQRSGQKYSQYQRQAGQVSRQPRQSRQTEAARQTRQTRQTERQHRNSSLVNVIILVTPIETRGNQHLAWLSKLSSDHTLLNSTFWGFTPSVQPG